jgi:Holliday junction resolvase RusA-like endonuclease
MITLTLRTKPVPVNQRTMFSNGRHNSSGKWKTAKKGLQEEAMVAIRTHKNFEPLTDTLAVNLLFYFGDNRKRDVDAYIKIVLDALEGIVYENDSQVVELHCYKEVCVDNPRTVVQIL